MAQRQLCLWTKWFQHLSPASFAKISFNYTSQFISKNYFSSCRLLIMVDSLFLENGKLVCAETSSRTIDGQSDPIDGFCLAVHRLPLTLFLPGRRWFSARQGGISILEKSRLPSQSCFFIILILQR